MSRGSYAKWKIGVDVDLGTATTMHAPSNYVSNSLTALADRERGLAI